jgi:hypothetical protein
VNPSACGAPLGPGTLLEYWLAELDPASEATVDAHLLGCAYCAAELERLLAIGEGLRTLLRDGRLHAVVPDAFVRRLAAAGIRLRQYRLGPGDAVDCTIGADDDLLVARLRAPLHGVGQLDVLVGDGAGQPAHRLVDVPFDPGAGEVLLAPATAAIRARGAFVETVRLVSVEAGRDRVLGEYVFRHSPWTG